MGQQLKLYFTRRILSTLFGLLLVGSEAAAQSSMLRISCESNDIGAEVSVNGKFKGECPLDIQVGAGNLTLRLVKKVDDLRERVFEQEIRMGEGTVKRVDARLGPQQLTAAGQRIEAQQKDAARLREQDREREMLLAEQLRQEAQARALIEFKAEGLEAGTGKSFRDCADCPEMVWIPPGKLLQGELAVKNVNARLNEVTLRYPLAVGKFEVTFDEWDRCVTDGGCSNSVIAGSAGGALLKARWGRGRQPIVNIAMDQVRHYLGWISKKSGQQYRLLSLSEFVYAAHAGRATRFPWGDQLGINNANCGNCGSSSGGQHPEPVGSFPANDWGLHDMVGNAFEIVADCNTDFTKWNNPPKDGSAITTNCAVTSPPSTREVYGDEFVSLGGSFSTRFADAIPLAYGIPIQTFYENTTNYTTGMRVARTFQPVTSKNGKSK